MFRPVLEDNVIPDEEAHLAKINQDVFESAQVHVRSCLSEAGCGIIRDAVTEMARCASTERSGGDSRQCL